MINIIKDFGRKIFIRMMRNKAVKCMPFDLHGRTLIIAPHPDDEVLGCGGLIAKLVADGNPPYIVILTGRGASHSNCCGLESESIVSERRKLTKDALSILNLPLENLFELDFKDGHISASDIEEIREFNKGRFYYLIFQTGASRQNLIKPRLSAFVSCKINDLV